MALSLQAQGCAATANPRPADQDPAVEIHRLALGLSNVYVVHADRALIVDTGPPGRDDDIIDALGRLGIEPARVSAILLTHAHRDHAGSAAALARQLRVPVIAHPEESPRAASGQSGPVRPSDPLALAGWPFVGGGFEPLDIATTAGGLPLADGLRLDHLGIPGRVVFTPGHTRGSIALLLDTADAFVGDLLAGSVADPSAPRPAFYTADDRPAPGHVPGTSSGPEPSAQSRAGLQRLLDLGAAVLHPGHGGPIPVGEAVERLAQPEPPRSPEAWRH